MCAVSSFSEFFDKVTKDFVTWFIDANGWLNVVKVVLYVVIGFIVVKLVTRATDNAFKKSKGKKKMSRLAANFLTNTLRVGLYFLYFILLFMLLGIDVSNVITVISAAGLAVSFALQKVASNFACGMILVANKPFEEGDFISVGGIDGKVVDIAMFSTRLLTPDNKIAVVPNSTLADNSVINYSANPKRRVDLIFNVSYDSDVELVKKILTEVLDGHELILHDDGYTVRLKEHGSSALVFVCRFWANKDDYWTCYFDVTERAFAAFRSAGIEIPYNKLDVSIIRDSGALLK